jgi:hypothetical protein
MAHCKTILSQILNLIPRHEFETLAANTIAAIYKSCWQIEMFFKWMGVVGVEDVF